MSESEIRAKALEDAAKIADSIAEGWESHPGGPLFHAKVKASMARFVAVNLRVQSKLEREDGKAP